MIGLSLREISRRLGYSVSALSEHQKKGRFKRLKDGSYDFGELLTACLRGRPIGQTQVRTRCEQANKISGQTANRRTSRRERCGGRNNGSSQLERDAGGGQTARHIAPPDAGGVSKIDPVPYPQNTLSGFKLSVVEWLANNIKAARDE